MRELILESEWSHFAAWGCLFFATLYFGLGLINEFCIRWLMPTMHHGGQLDPRPLNSGQLRREIGLSIISILIFGIGSLIPWYLLKTGYAELALNCSWWQIMIEVIALIIWNEIHFYINHWLLHTRWLKRFHMPHHRSVVATPWSTYSFHPIEAMMLGNVMIPPMLLHDFNVWSLLMLPVFSIVFNNIGHSNYDFLPDAERDRWWLNAARRHHLHHACFHGNYGFMFPFMDRLFGTNLGPDAADTHIARHKEKLTSDAV